MSTHSNQNQVLANQVLVTRRLCRAYIRTLLLLCYAVCRIRGPPSLTYALFANHQQRLSHSLQFANPLPFSAIVSFVYLVPRPIPLAPFPFALFAPQRPHTRQGPVNALKDLANLVPSVNAQIMAVGYVFLFVTDKF